MRNHKVEKKTNKQINNNNNSQSGMRADQLCSLSWACAWITFDHDLWIIIRNSESIFQSWLCASNKFRKKKTRIQFLFNFYSKTWFIRIDSPKVLNQNVSQRFLPLHIHNFSITSVTNSRTRTRWNPFSRRSLCRIFRICFWHRMTWYWFRLMGLFRK